MSYIFKKSAVLPAAFGLAALALSVWLLVIGVRSPPTHRAEQLRFAAHSIACPTAPGFVDPGRLQLAIDEQIRKAAIDLRSATPAQAQATLTDAQAAVCTLVVQNPMRGLSWAQLLSLSPEVARDPVARAQFYRLSHDLSRLEVDSARARLIYASPRWRILTDGEKSLVVADARMLAQVPIGNDAVVQLALLGQSGGADLLDQMRAIITDYQPQWLYSFDAYAAMNQRKAN